MPTRRSPFSTTGTPLMPFSDSSFASSCTVVSGVTVITGVVMTSMARIDSLQPHFLDETYNISITP